MGGVFWAGGLTAIQRFDARPPAAWEGGEADDVVACRRILFDLVERDYLLRIPDSTFKDDDEYVFKHNLEREALVNLTPAASARLYHQAIAEWLTFREGTDAGEEYLEMLARHREKGGATALAATSYVQAGEVARSRYANAKAVELFAKGLELMDGCDQPDEHLRLKTLHSLGDVLQSLGRNGEALVAFEDMLARAWRLDLRSKGGAAHARIGRLHRETGRLEEASRHLTAALALFGQAGDDRGIASTLDDIGKLHRLKGDFAVALEYTERALAMRRKLGDRANVALSLHNLGLVELDSGNQARAVDAFDQALQLRRELGDVVGMSLTLEALGKVSHAKGDDERTLALFQEAYDLAKDTGDRSRIKSILKNLGEAHRRLGQPDKAAAAVRQAEELGGDVVVEGS
jgi:tetratricopeptide (TPR) repeat protein